jgi:spore coat polysaccharide biosynthesis protein SpsF
MPKKLRIAITVEARMGSTRLPGKCDLPILHSTTTGILVERLKRVKKADEIVIATTTNAKDALFEERAKEFGVKCFRGSEEDVMSRVIGAAESVGADLIVEVTGDCLLLDPKLVDLGIEIFLKGGCDVVTNVMDGKVSYPQGMDVQVFPTKLLKDAYPLTDEELKEHVSLYFYRNPSKYKIRFLEAPASQRLPDWRLMLDYEADYRLLKSVYERLYPADPCFGGVFSSLPRRRIDSIRWESQIANRKSQMCWSLPAIPAARAS